MMAPPPGRPYGLRQEATRIIREVREMSASLASASDRLRDKHRQHAELGRSLHERLDAIDAIEARALPIIEREIAEREYNVQALENDATVIERLARELDGTNRGPTVSPRPGGGSGSSEPPKVGEEGAEVSRETGPG